MRKLHGYLHLRITTTISIKKNDPPISKIYALTPIMQVWPMLISYEGPSKFNFLAFVMGVID
jgi:hypothetical protein